MWHRRGWESIHCTHVWRRRAEFEGQVWGSPRLSNDFVILGSWIRPSKYLPHNSRFFFLERSQFMPEGSVTHTHFIVVVGMLLWGVHLRYSRCVVTCSIHERMGLETAIFNLIVSPFFFICFEKKYWLAFYLIHTYIGHWVMDAIPWDDDGHAFHFNAFVDRRKDHLSHRIEGT